jgi:acyl dehydratase
VLVVVRGVYSDLEKRIIEDFEIDAETRAGWQKTSVGPNARSISASPVITTEEIKKFGYETDKWNPFWYMENYASISRWGGLIAHPWFGSQYKPDEKMFNTIKGLFRTFYLMGHDIECYQPIRAGDTIRTWARKPTIEESTAPDGSGPRKFRYIDGWGDMINQRNEIVYTEKQFVEVTLWDVPITVEKWMDDYGYTTKELDFMTALTEAEKPCGGEVRYWEDTKVGDKLQTICWGPTEFTSGGAEPHPSLNEVPKRTFTKYVEPLGGPVGGLGYVPDKKTGLLYPTHGGRHAWDRSAQFEGGSRAFIFNHESRLPMTRCVTNWIGDDAFLCKFSWRHVWRTPVGDTLLVHGKVVKKYEENGEHLVDVSVYCLNLRGTITDMANATVKLVSRTENFPGAVKVLNR